MSKILIVGNPAEHQLAALTTLERQRNSVIVAAQENERYFGPSVDEQVAGLVKARGCFVETYSNTNFKKPYTPSKTNNEPFYRGLRKYRNRQS